MMSSLSGTAEGQIAESGGAETAAGRLSAEELCRSHSALVCRFAAMAAGSGVEADDLAQEALLKAVRNLDRYDPSRGSIDRWLWRIVVNVARDQHRSGARRRALWTRLLEHWYEAEGTVEGRALDSIDNQELMEAIRSLSERDRLLVALRFGADLDLAGVGQAVGLSTDSAGQAVLRALARLRSRLEATK